MANKAEQPSAKRSAGHSPFAEAGEGKPLSLLAEFSLFIVENKKWPLIPILLVLGLVGLLVVFGSGGAAPFIYTLI